MKVRREQFLAAAFALSAAAGCDVTAAIASRISPEKPQAAPEPAAQADPAGNDSPERRGDPGNEGSGQQATGVTRTPSPTFEAKVSPSPTKEWMPSPAKEANLPSPTKEANLPSPTKEWMPPPSPTKEAGVTKSR